MGKKNSEGQDKRWESVERREKMSERFRQLWQDPEYRQRVTDARKKLWADPARRAAASERGKLRRHSPEVKEKIAAGNRGKKMSAESIEKMRAAKKGKKHTDAFKQQVSERHKGKKLSDETKRRMSEAVKERFKDPARKAASSLGRRKFWATLSAEERTRITRPGRLACLEATRLREPTSIERIVAGILSDMGVAFEQQVLFKYYSADIFLPDHNVIIECDGDYWHSTPVMIAHDKKRDKWFANHSIGVIRLKECDIKADARQCVEQVLKGLGWQP